MHILTVRVLRMLPAKSASGKPSKAWPFALHPAPLGDIATLPQIVPQVANTSTGNYQILAPEAID